MSSFLFSAECAFKALRPLFRGFPAIRAQPARELPSVCRFVRREDRRPVSEELSRRCSRLPEPSFRCFSFVGVVPARRLLNAGGKDVFSLMSVRGSHRSSGFYWTYGLRYFLIPLATGIMIFGAGFAKEEWRQYCLGGRKRRRSAIATDFDDPPYAPEPAPPLPDPASIPSILKKKKKKKKEEDGVEKRHVRFAPDVTKKEEDGQKKEEDDQKKEEKGAEKRHVRFAPDVKKE